MTRFPHYWLAALLALLIITPAHAAVTRGWAPTGSMAAGRTGHSAVLLDNGKVLVAGGSLASAALRSAELYDPASGQWTTAGAMAVARAGFSMIKLANGKVLAAGGMGEAGASLASSELYDPATNQWSPTQTGLATARSDASIALLENGRAVIVGGVAAAGDGSEDVSLASAEVFDPASRTWSAVGNALTGARSFAGAAALPGNRLLVTGGHGEDGVSFRDSYIYDPVLRRFSQARIMGDARTMFTLSALPDGRVLAAGGANNTTYLTNAEYFDPQREVWTATLPLATNHYMHTASVVSGGKVLIAGGYDYLRASVTTELYDPNTNAWTVAGNLRAGHYFHTATTLTDGRVLIVGGYPDPASAELWWPTTSVTSDPGLAFGNVVPGATASAAVQVTNTGDAPLFADDFALAGAQPGEFGLGADRCHGPIAPGATCLVDVRFTPAAEGPRSATLTFSANIAGGTQAIPLSGLGALPLAGGGVVGTATDRCPTGCPRGLLNDPSIRYRQGKSGIRVLAYYVKATTGARIVVTCSRGCKRTVAKGRGSRRVRISGLTGRRLANGTRITVTVSMPGRLTTTVYDNIARGRRTEGRPRCTAPATLGPLLGC